MKISIPNLSRDKAIDLIRFFLGGSGLENMDELPEFNLTYMNEISQLYDVWSSGYDPQSFFELVQVSVALKNFIKFFLYFFKTKFGYKCSDLFHYCELAGKPTECCKELFQRRSVMRRGICYQTRRDVNQVIFFINFFIF